MTFRNYISSLTIIVLTLAIYSCKTSPKLEFKVSHLDTTIKATKISISELADNYKNYQGQYIETTGKFYQGFEEFAIYTDKSLLTGESKQFWLGTDRDLKIDNTSFDKMNGKRITIKGVIDTTSKGHLSSYLATIRKIYFWKEQ
jgi:hypothetical protein